MKGRSNLPRSQKLFVVFSLLFVITVAIFISTNSSFAPLPANTSLPTYQNSSTDNTSSFGGASSDTQSPDYFESSDVTSMPQSTDTSLPSESSEESTWQPPESSEPATSLPPQGTVVSDLPYSPSEYLTLTKDDILPSELDEYFADSVFIGNSLVVHFYNYYCVLRARDKGFLGGAEFVCSSAFSARLDLRDLPGNRKYYPRYNGELVHTWEAVEQIKPKTVYYNLMGLNELGLHPYSQTAELTFDSNRQVMEKILAAHPGVKLVVLSNTYMIESFNGEQNGLNNHNISKLNALALEWCNQNGHDFIDISTPFLDGNVMPDKYCSDPNGCGCHLKADYYSAWTAILRNYSYQKQNNSWKNPDDIKILAAGKKVYS